MLFRNPPFGPNMKQTQTALYVHVNWFLIMPEHVI